VGAAVGLLLVGALVGGGIGALVRSGVDRTPLRGIDRFFGGVVSVAITALVLVVVAPGVTVTGFPGFAAAIASSRALSVIDALTPPPMDAALAQLRSALFEDGLPRFGELLGPGGAPAAPPVALDDPVLQQAAASVARVSGVAYACGTGMSGTGFVVAPDRVVTNAHVVAGVEAPVVELPGQSARDGRIVYFDDGDDLAVIAVDDLGVAALPLVVTLAPGAAAVVQGYPYGGPFTMGGASVLSVGAVPIPDIYGDSATLREIYALDAEVQPGNSGGPLLTSGGEVAGVVFARGEDDARRGYAMTMAELVPVASQATSWTDAVTPGRCTS
jgi:S1-C subfamily serine protease